MKYFFVFLLAMLAIIAALILALIIATSFIYLIWLIFNPAQAKIKLQEFKSRVEKLKGWWPLKKKRKGNKMSPWLKLGIPFLFLSVIFGVYLLVTKFASNDDFNHPWWQWVIFSIVVLGIVYLIFFKKIKKAILKTSTTNSTSKVTNTSAPASKNKLPFKWGLLIKRIALTVVTALVLFYGVQFWKEPTLVTSFFKEIFHRKELELDKWFGVNAGEKYSVIVGRNTLGIWPTVKGNDTVTVTVRNSEGQESYKTWNDYQGKRHEQRLTPSLKPAMGVFTFIFDKDVEMRLSTMPPK